MDPLTANGNPVGNDDSDMDKLLGVGYGTQIDILVPTPDKRSADNRMWLF